MFSFFFAIEIEICFAPTSRSLIGLPNASTSNVMPVGKVAENFVQNNIQSQQQQQQQQMM